MVHIYTVRSDDGVGLDLGKVLALEDALKKGVEATSKILKAYRKPDRIQGTLEQLLKLARAVTAEIQSCDQSKMNTTTQHPLQPTSNGTGLANSQLNLGMFNGGIPQDGRNAMFVHSWPGLNVDTFQHSAARVENDNLQNLLWDNDGTGNGGGWNDIDFGFEDIVTF